MALLMQQFQAARCPHDTFFWASNQVPTALQIVPLFFPALGVWFLTANWLIAAIPVEDAISSPIALLRFASQGRLRRDDSTES